MYDARGHGSAVSCATRTSQDSGEDITFTDTWAALYRDNTFIDYHSVGQLQPVGENIYAACTLYYGLYDQCDDVYVVQRKGIKVSPINKTLITRLFRKAPNR